jgi:hypothetical protein
MGVIYALLNSILEELASEGRIRIKRNVYITFYINVNYMMPT